MRPLKITMSHSNHKVSEVLAIMPSSVLQIPTQQMCSGSYMLGQCLQTNNMLYWKYAKYTVGLGPSHVSWVSEVRVQQSI